MVCITDCRTELVSRFREGKKEREREQRVANNNDKGSNSECWI